MASDDNNNNNRRSPSSFQILINGMNIATFITVISILAVVMRWTGIVDTKITNLEEWKNSHIAQRHGDR